jgi:hypothetical protein
MTADAHARTVEDHLHDDLRNDRDQLLAKLDGLGFGRPAAVDVPRPAEIGRHAAHAAAEEAERRYGGRGA